MKYLIMGFENFFNFRDRATRTEYWMFFLTTFLISLTLAFISVYIGMEWLSSLFSLAIFIPSISFGARRLHDTGRSGWWQLLYLIPLIGFIILIILLVFESDEDNKYGERKNKNVLNVDQ